MKVETITNNNGDPVAVNILYKDWLGIASKLNISPTGDRITGLDWFAKTESANSILNGLFAYYNCEIIEQKRSNSPNPEKITELESKVKEIHKLLKNPGTFESIQTMDFVIESYGPILKAINLAAKIK